MAGRVLGGGCLVISIKTEMDYKLFIQIAQFKYDFHKMAWSSVSSSFVSHNS